MRLLEGLADLSEDVNRSARRHRAVLPDEGLEIHPVEHLHHVVERLILGHPEVVDLDGVGRAEIRCGFRLAGEALHGELRRVTVARAERFGTNELHGGGAREHGVGGPVDLTHAPAAQQVTEPVAPHLARLRHLSPELRHDVRDDPSDTDEQIVGVVHDEDVARGAEIPCTVRARDEHAEGIHRDGDERGDHGLLRRCGHDGREHQHHRANP